MANKLTRSRIALPGDRPRLSLQPRLKSSLVLTEPSSLLYSALLGGRFAQFPDSVRMDVAQAIARVVDVESEPEEQKRAMESCLASLEAIHGFGGERAVSSWCTTIRECGCFLGSAEMAATLSGVVEWAKENIDQKNGGARAYLEVALVRGAEAVREPAVLAVLEKAGEENGAIGGDVLPPLAVMFAAISARWGLEKAKRTAESMLSLGMSDMDFLSSALQICGSSGSELDLLVESLEKDGRMLWAVPEMNQGTLARFMRRPGEIIEAILKREGFPSEDMALTLAQRQERLGLMSAMADSRALKHPDKAVRQAAMKRLTAVAAGASNPPFIRKISMKSLAGVWDELSEAEAGRLKSVLMDADDDKEVRIYFAARLFGELLKKPDHRFFQKYFAHQPGLPGWTSRMDGIPVRLLYELTLVAIHYSEGKEREAVRCVAAQLAMEANTKFHPDSGSIPEREFDVLEGKYIVCAKCLREPWVARLIARHHESIAAELVARIIAMEDKSRCGEVADIMCDDRMVAAIGRFAPETKEGRKTALEIADNLLFLAKRSESATLATASAIGAYEGMPETAVVVSERLLGIWGENEGRFAEAVKGASRPEVLEAIRRFGAPEFPLSLAARLVAESADGEMRGVEAALRVKEALSLPEISELAGGTTKDKEAEMRQHVAYVAASGGDALGAAVGLIGSVSSSSANIEIAKKLAVISDRGEDSVLGTIRTMGLFAKHIKEERKHSFTYDFVDEMATIYQREGGKEAAGEVMELLESYSDAPRLALGIFYVMRTSYHYLDNERILLGVKAFRNPEVANALKRLGDEPACVMWIGIFAADGEAAALKASRAFMHASQNGEDTGIIRKKFSKTSKNKAWEAVEAILKDALASP